MLVKDLLEVIDRLAPFGLSEDWDNTGLLAGSRNTPVTGCAVCVDLVPEVLSLAEESRANVIISHHPYIFDPVRRLDFDDNPQLQLLRELIKKDMALIAAHTNLDSAEGGINDALAELLGMRSTRPLAPSDTDASAGLGRIGEIDPVDTGAFVEMLQEKLGIAVRHNGVNRTIRTLAVCGGSGMSLYEQAKKADCFVTAEVKRHQLVQAALEGVLLADCGHFETELPGTMKFARRLTEAGVPVFVYPGAF